MKKKNSGRPWYFVIFYFKRMLSMRLKPLKVHKRENFLGSDFEICTFS